MASVCPDRLRVSRAPQAIEGFGLPCGRCFRHRQLVMACNEFAARHRACQTQPLSRNDRQASIGSGRLAGPCQRPWPPKVGWRWAPPFRSPTVHARSAERWLNPDDRCRWWLAVLLVSPVTGLTQPFPKIEDDSLGITAPSPQRCASATRDSRPVTPSSASWPP